MSFVLRGSSAGRLPTVLISSLPLTDIYAYYSSFLPFGSAGVLALRSKLRIITLRFTLLLPLRTTLYRIGITTGCHYWRNRSKQDSSRRVVDNNAIDSWIGKSRVNLVK